VTFGELGPELIDSYLASGEWRGRAGGYAVQGLGSALVSGIEGDVSNVIGLPIPLLLRLAPELISG
jgi:septum formation protein